MVGETGFPTYSFGHSEGVFQVTAIREIFRMSAPLNQSKGLVKGTICGTICGTVCAHRIGPKHKSRGNNQGQF